MEVPPCLRCERLAEGLPEPLQESADGTSGVSADGMMGDVWVNFTRCFSFFLFYQGISEIGHNINIY